MMKKRIIFAKIVSIFLALSLAFGIFGMQSAFAITSDDFDSVCTTISSITDAATCTAKITSENAAKVIEAYQQYINNATTKAGLDLANADFENKFKAAVKRANMFECGVFDYNAQTDASIRKYLATNTKTVANPTTYTWLFSTAENKTALPTVSITRTFDYQTQDRNSTSARIITATNEDIALDNTVFRVTDGSIYLGPVKNDSVPNMQFSWLSIGSSGFAFCGYTTDTARNSFKVGTVSGDVYNMYPITFRISFEKLTTGANVGKYRAVLVMDNNNGLTYTLNGANYYDTEAAIYSQLFFAIRDVNGASEDMVASGDISTSLNYRNHLSDFSVVYPSIAEAKFNSANTYAESLDLSKIKSSDKEEINANYYLVSVCGDSDYITGANKTKIINAKTILNYLISENIESITTPSKIDAISGNITDKQAVTDLYDEAQQIINLGLSAMFSDAQTHKLAALNAVAGVMSTKDLITYDATSILNLVKSIDNFNSKQVLNNIAFQTELVKLEKSLAAIDNDYKSAVVNSGSLTSIRTKYEALVTSGKYVDNTAITFEKTGKRYSANETLGADAPAETGVVSYVNNVDLSNGINKISFNLPVSGNQADAKKMFVYSYNGDVNGDKLADISGLSFFGVNNYSGLRYIFNTETYYTNTKEIPQDCQYFQSTIRNYGESNYQTRWTAGWIPQDTAKAFNGNNVLLWYTSSDNFGATKTGNNYNSDSITTFLTDNGYSTIYPLGNMNVTMEYQGDGNTVKGVNWYLITISGNFQMKKTDGTFVNEEKTVYSRLFTNGRITTAGVTHASTQNPEDVLKISSLEVNKTPVRLTTGASVRLADGADAGIRFESKINKVIYDNLKAIDGVTVTCGTVIVPKDYLTGVTEFTMAALDIAGKDYLNIPQTKWKDELNGVYTAAMTNIKPGNYTREFASRGYIKVTYADGQTDYYYSNYDEVANVRSVAAVAGKALDDTSVTYTAGEITILKTFAGRS